MFLCGYLRIPIRIQITGLNAFLAYICDILHTWHVSFWIPVICAFKFPSTIGSLLLIKITESPMLEFNTVLHLKSFTEIAKDEDRLIINQYLSGTQYSTSASYIFWKHLKDPEFSMNYIPQNNANLEAPASFDSRNYPKHFREFRNSLNITRYLEKASEYDVDDTFTANSKIFKKRCYQDLCNFSILRVAV